MLKRFFGALVATVLTAGAAQAAHPSITLYSEPGFRGESITIRQDIDNFAKLPPWNDRARSLVVNGGTWEVCKHKNYDKCRTLAPGAQISHLGEIKYLGEISSLRSLDSYGRRDPRHDDRRWDDRRWDDRRWDDRRGRDDDWGRDPWNRPAPPVHRPSPRWGDDDVIWDDPRQKPYPVNNLTACQRTVYEGFVDRYGRRAQVEFTGSGRDGTVWWNGEPWRYRCGGGQINIWQESRW